MDNNYFRIDIEMLKLQEEEEALFPFHLYIYNPSSDSYTPYLFANSPLVKEKQEFLDYILNKGGELAVSLKQKLTFLTHSEIKEDEIPDLKEPETHELLLKREERIAKLEKAQEKKGKFHFRQQLTKTMGTDDWWPLIENAKIEIMALSVTRSHTCSLATLLAEILLTEDNYTNRMLALSYHLCKNTGMDDDQALGDLVCATFFSHLGQTQLDFDFSHQAHIEMNDKRRKEYKKHPGLAQHLIRKSGVVLSERCVNIINQHHERFDGTGYPDQKTGAFIEPLALVLGAASHLVEYHTGKVSGSKTALNAIIHNIKNKTLSPGLEIEFGDTLYESIIYLLDKENETEDNGSEQIAA